MEPVIPPPSSGRPASRGIIGELLGLLGSFGDHVQALFALIGLETREAAGIYLRVALFLIIALIAVIFFYIFFLLFIAFGLALLFHMEWIWITLGLAGLHLAGAAGCLIYVKKRLATPVFAATAEEFRKDFAALKTYKP